MVKFLLLFSFKQEHHNRVGDAQKYAAAVTSDTLDDHGDTEDVAKDVADTGGSSEADALINIFIAFMYAQGGRQCSSDRNSDCDRQVFPPLLLVLGGWSELPVLQIARVCPL